MKVRNPVYTETGDIDCEINHPQHGWIPFTASPNDVEKHGRDIHAKLKAGKAGPVAPAPPPLPENRESIIARVRESFRKKLETNPPADINERVQMLEIAVGIREPSEADIQKETK